MSEEQVRGRFIWYDLMTNDIVGARVFYPRIVGWAIQDFESGGDTYPMWTQGGTPIGGAQKLPNPKAPAHWLGYIGTPDVEATVERAQGLGGRVLAPVRDIPGTGRFAILQDPQGAVFAAFTPQGEAPGTTGPPEVGDFSWHELATTDIDAAFDFYTSLFGWQGSGETETEFGRYKMFRHPDVGYPMGGIYETTPDQGPPGWLFYVRVADAVGAADHVRQHGGMVVVPPREVPGGDTVAQAVDPAGARFAVHYSTGGPGWTP